MNSPQNPQDTTSSKFRKVGRRVGSSGQPLIGSIPVPQGFYKLALQIFFRNIFLQLEEYKKGKTHFPAPFLCRQWMLYQYTARTKVGQNG